MAAAALTGTVTMTGCSADLAFDDISENVHRMVIDDIYVKPQGWNTVWFSEEQGGGVQYMYADIDMPEITRSVIYGGACLTYLKPDNDRPIQEMLPVTVFNEEANGHAWSYTITCEYSVGKMTIILRPSDFKSVSPGTLYFRTVVLY
jgi:hypothetical protein